MRCFEAYSIIYYNSIEIVDLFDLIVLVCTLGWKRTLPEGSEQHSKMTILSTLYAF